jgi:transposase
MFSLPAGAHIWIAAGVTDLRRGFTGLSAVAQTVLQQDPLPDMCLCSVDDAAI